MHAETTLPSTASPTVSASRRVRAASWSVARVVPALALILLATTWPITDFQDHAHWDEVAWIPFSHYFGPFDLVANVVLFVPFGLAVGWGSTTHRRAGVLAQPLGHGGRPRQQRHRGRGCGEGGPSRGPARLRRAAG